MAFRKLYDVNPIGGGTTYGGGMRVGVPIPAPAPRPSIAPFNPNIQRGMGAPAPLGSNAGRSPAGVRWATDMRPPAPVATAAAHQNPKISPFMWNMFGSMKTMDVDERADYLSNLAAGIKDKIDQYGLRLARGRALTPEQQARYDSLRSSFSDIQGYITNQSAYDEYLNRIGNLTPEQYEASEIDRVLKARQRQLFYNM